MRKAFTLIELLVVISIIALLIAILLPVLIKARDSGRMTQCMSNVRGLSQSLYASAADNKGRFLELGPHARSWTLLVQDYMSDAPRTSPAGIPLGYFETNFCPEAPLNKSEQEIEALTAGTSGTATTPYFHAWQKNQPNGGIYAGSYGLNAFVGYKGSSGYGDLKMYARTIENVKDASLFPMFADALWIDAFPMGKGYEPKPAAFEGLGTQQIDLGVEEGIMRFAIDRHALRQNVGYVDGHAETIGIEQLWALKWHQKFDPNNLP